MSGQNGETATTTWTADQVRGALGIGETRVVREPLTYTRHAPFSYFRDLIFRDQDQGARERLDRHGKEMAPELERRGKRAEARTRERTEPGEVLSGIEYRVDPNRTQGQGGYFAPPLWLIDQFATAPRPARILSRLVGNAGMAFPLPAGVQSVNLPRLTTGTQALGGPDLMGSPDQDIVDASAASAVATIDGTEDVALQLLEQSPAGAHLDAMLFKDLSEAYDADLETMLLYGTGTGGQFTGITGLSLGNNAVSYTGTATATSMFPYFGRVMSQIGNNRNLPLEAWMFRTSRWGWLATSEDMQNRPLGLTDYIGLWPWASLAAIPVYLNDSIGTNIGASGQDEVIACRPSDMLLFESDQRTSVMVEPLSGTLGVRLQLRGYAAFIPRYPSSIATLSGSGMAIQTGFTT